MKLEKLSCWTSSLFQAVMIALLSGIAVAVILLAVAKAMGIDLIDAYWR